MLTVDNLRLLGDRVLVDPDPRLETTEGGLTIPDTVLRDNPNYFSMTGIVLKLGDGALDATWECVTCGQWSDIDRGSCTRCGLQLAGTNLRYRDSGNGERRAFDVEVGQRVLFNRFAGRQVELEIAYPTFLVLDYWEKLKEHDINPHKRFLIMREHEILGIVEGKHRIVPGYEAPKWGKTTDGNRPGVQVL